MIGKPTPTITKSKKVISECYCRRPSVFVHSWERPSGANAGNCECLTDFIAGESAPTNNSSISAATLDFSLRGNDDALLLQLR